jgi:hypothetical protein
MFKALFCAVMTLSRFSQVMSAVVPMDIEFEPVAPVVVPVKRDADEAGLPQNPRPVKIRRLN